MAFFRNQDPGVRLDDGVVEPSGADIEKVRLAALRDGEKITGDEARRRLLDRLAGNPPVGAVVVPDAALHPHGAPAAGEAELGHADAHKAEAEGDGGTSSPSEGSRGEAKPSPASGGEADERQTTAPEVRGAERVAGSNNNADLTPAPIIPDITPAHIKYADIPPASENKDQAPANNNAPDSPAPEKRKRGRPPLTAEAKAARAGVLAAARKARDKGRQRHAPEAERSTVAVTFRVPRALAKDIMKLPPRQRAAVVAAWYFCDIVGLDAVALVAAVGEIRRVGNLLNQSLAALHSGAVAPELVERVEALVDSINATRGNK